MAPEQSTFIRQLKITLIAVLGPFILVTIGSMITDHFRIENLNNHIEAIEDAYVSRDVHMIYMNELRVQNGLIRELMDEGDGEAQAQIDLIEKRLNELIKEVYKNTPRGATKIDELSFNGH